MPADALQQHDPARQRARFLADVLAGLSRTPRALPCKYLYDARGSQLFDAICELPEYYLTRTELEIMERHAREMGAEIGPGAMLVEFGSGSSVKTRILLDHLPDAAAYVPVDISREHLERSAEALARDYPTLEVLPVYADFTAPFDLPRAPSGVRHVAVYFPGSTIGNLRPDRAAALLGRIADLCGPGGGLLIGIDLQKDPAVLEAAYDDAAGVTAAFTRNYLARIDRELGGDFDLDGFRHRARYDDREGRIEIHLVSTRAQTVTIQGQAFAFEEGEAIHIEDSHKYTIDGFAALAAESGLELRRHWSDPRQWFAVLYLERRPGGPMR